MNIFQQTARKWAALWHECQAQCALARDQRDQAQWHSVAFHALEPQNPHANFLVAQIFVAEGRHEEALPYLEMTARHWPDDVPTLYALAVCHDYLDQPQEAAAAYRRTFALAPHWIVTLKHLGRCCWRMGDARGAEEALTRYCAEAPDDKEAHDLLGYLCYQQGHLRVSYGHYAEAARLDPRDPKLDRNARLLYRRSALS